MSTDAAPPAKRGNALRIALFVVLAIAIVLLGLDWYAQKNATALEEQLLAELKKPQKPTAEDVHKIAGEPDAINDDVGVPNTVVEEYHFQGFKRHKVYVAYRTDREKMQLDGVQVNVEFDKNSF